MPQRWTTFFAAVVLVVATTVAGTAQQESTDELRARAEQGDAEAQGSLGTIYANGDGVTQDYAEAMRWYRRAADQGDFYAQHNIGVMYNNGEGVRQDYAEARRWYRLSANQGWPDAYSSLGLMYHHGRGVVQDYVEAHMWFHLAATSPGFSRDRYYWAREREVVGAKMTAEQIAEAQRRAREWIEAPRRPYPSFGSGTWGEFSTSPKH